ncbi:MAG: B12-binding domain-containing radical SAM protein [Solirubrobacterales bacterium]
MRHGEADVLFVDVPHDFACPRSSWCLGYRCLISALRANGFAARILHPQTGGDGRARARMIQDIVGAHAGIVGFSTYDVQLPQLLVLIADLRRAGLRSHVTLGGLCASAIPELILCHAPGVDSIVFGEGDITVVDLARRVLRGEGGGRPLPGIALRGQEGTNTGGPAPPPELDALAAPILDDFRDPHQSAALHLVNDCVPVAGSRGCYGRCTFCCIHKFYRASGGRLWRPRSAATIVDDILAVRRTTPYQRVTFVDENFMGPGPAGRRHADEVAREIAARAPGTAFNLGCRPNDVDRGTFAALKSAGLAGVSLGIESMGNEALALFNKRTTPQINEAAVQLLEELGIFTEVTFIFFHPLSTLEETRANLAFVERVRRSRYAYFNNAQPFSELIPFFGTDLTRSLAERGLVERTIDGYTVRYADPRVGLIARSILGVPVDTLSRLGAMIPNDDNELADVAADLERAELHLKMVRLPGLAADLCAAFEGGASESSSGVLAALAEIRREAATITLLADRFLAHVA